MQFFESIGHVEQFCSEHLGRRATDEILRRSMPAIALRIADDESESWLYGDKAMIETGVGWPSVDGRVLQHMARIKLDGLPKVLHDQPETGYLSFFDGFVWGDQTGWDLARYGQVRYDDGRSVEEISCPPITVDDLGPNYPAFVEAEGPYWTIPPMEEVRQIVPSGDEDAFRDFATELEFATVDNLFYGQLFGRVNPIQSDMVPQPLLDPQRYRDEGASGWLHLASFRHASTIFDSYYAIEVQDLRDRTFARLKFTAQCD